MAKHLSLRQAAEDGQHGNDLSADELEKAKEFVTSRRESSELRLVFHGRQSNRRSPLADIERAYVTAPQDGEDSQTSGRVSLDRDTYQETDDEDEAEGDNDNDGLPHFCEIIKTSLSSHLTTLNNEWNTSLTKQLYSRHLSHKSHRRGNGKWGVATPDALVFLTETKSSSCKYLVSSVSADGLIAVKSHNTVDETVEGL
ncbi:hypothetical protein E4U43_007303 [Claviceps pusilla]|uniref:Uncharacterized protein n=1 Tax=Claviceps pusilla TaxID=123648 RepID=A0A9P7SZ75_9HYPO|nr:hypothetical protein E4U43_007303 [Claviceps pusilla]